MNFLKKITGLEVKKKEESWRQKVSNSTPNALEDPQNHPMKLFIVSVDTLCGKPIDQKLKEGWSEKPPLFQHKRNPDSDRTLKSMCRDGIPPALRSAIWITSIVRISRPYQNKSERYDFGTLSKVKVLDHGWEYVLKSLFPDESDKEAATIPDFGLDPKDVEALLVHDHLMDDDNLSEKGVKGVKSLTLVLYAVKENLGIEYCPLLPDLTAYLLSTMPESYAYTCLREMTNAGGHYFPMSKVEHLSWCKTFGDLLKRMYPPTALAMSRCGALTPDGLDPIFRRLFATILKKEHVYRILDIYTIEGYKVLFRLGTIILCLTHFHLEPEELKTTESFWAGVRRVAHSDIFHFDVLVKQSYGFSGRKYKSRRSFPRRRFIQRLMSYNERWAENVATSHVLQLTLKPLGFVEGNIPIVLAKNVSARLSLAEFLPFSYKSTKLEPIYSTNVHGRSIDAFYKHCGRAKHTITLVEVLNTGAVIGMFATETWHKSSKVYGDGECVLFRLNPDPICFQWTHDITKSMSAGPYNDEEEMENIKSEAMLEQFMLSRENFISMGGNEDGSSGLRLNEDLSKGSSSRARGFNNEPLAGNNETEFDVGLVEVYHLLRELDGKAIDGDEDLWKGMFD